MRGGRGAVMAAMGLLLLATISSFPSGTAGSPSHNDAGLGHDAGDTRTAASLIADSGHFTGRLYAETDENDWYGFTIDSVLGSPGRPIVEFLLLSHADADYDVELYRPGTMDPVALGRGAVGSRAIRYSADTSGTWHVHVTGEAKTGSYAFSLDLRSEDDASLGRDAADGTQISVGSGLPSVPATGLVVSGELAPADSGDLFRVTVPDGNPNLLVLLEFPDNAPLNLQILRPTNALVGADVQRSGPGARSAFVESAAPNSWGIRILPGDAGTRGSYTLSVVLGGGSPDAGKNADAGNTLNSPVALTEGLYTGSLNTQTDLGDSFSFAGVKQGDVLHVAAAAHTADPLQRPKLVLFVFDTAKNERARLAMCENAGGLTVTAPNDGTYYVRVSEARDVLGTCTGVDAPRAGAYGLLLSKAEQDETGDGDAPHAESSADLIPADAAIRGWIDPYDARDSYDLGTLALRSELQAILVSAVPNRDLRLVLVDRVSQTVAQASTAESSAGRIHLVVGRETGHSLRVEDPHAGTDDGTSGGYLLWVRRLANQPPAPVTLDDPPDEAVGRRSVALQWTASPSPDFAAYEVHRAEAGGFSPSATTRVATLDDRTRTSHTVTGLEPGKSYTFVVRTLDEAGLAGDSNRRTETTESGLIGSSPPTLTNGRVDPPSGTPSTTFTFRVTYTDADNDPPTIKRVYVSGAPYAMTSSDATYTDGSAFTFQTTLPAGTHSFYFEFADGEFPSQRDPIQGTHAGPTVTGSGNQAPTVDARATPTDGEAPLEVDFEAVASDPEGDPLSYVWDFDNSDGFQADSNQRTPQHTYETPGGYTATVRVTDSKGSQSTDSVSINVRASSNAAPTVNPSATPSSGFAPLTVDFNAGASDSDGTITDYVWDFDNADGLQVESTQSSPEHTYTAPGTYVATVTVEDNGGRRSTGSVTVSVSGASNRPPTIVIQASPERGPAPLTVSFQANVVDPDADAVTVSWDFDVSNGISTDATGTAVTRAFQRAGTFTVLATARDTGNAAATSSVQIEVLSPEASGVQFFIDAEPRAGKAPLTVEFHANGSGLPYPIIDYDWDFGDGTPHASGIAPNHTYVVRGTYLVTLDATDSSGNVRQSTIEIRVDSKGSPGVPGLAVLAVVAVLALLRRPRS